MHYLIFSELKEYWVNKQKEVEERFLDLSEKESMVLGPQPKKRKIVQKKTQKDLSDSFAKQAAELQIEFFTKVCVIFPERFRKVKIVVNYYCP